MATFTVIGRIGKDAELRKFGEGEHDFVTDVWVAENRKKRDGSTKTLWHKVTIWRNYAETMAQYLKTGRKVYVTGSPEAKFYTNKAQQIVPYIKVQASELTLLDAPKTEGAPEPAAEPAEVAVPENPWDEV